MLQTLVFALTVAIMAFHVFVLLRPFAQATDVETRRCTELLSQLPPDVDVMAFVNRTLLLDLGTRLDDDASVRKPRPRSGACVVARPRPGVRLVLRMLLSAASASPGSPLPCFVQDAVPGTRLEQTGTSRRPSHRSSRNHKDVEGRHWGLA